jgi:catechol 2,3-dioxygenase-like lactoylglutathione lyase family enzyme
MKDAQARVRFEGSQPILRVEDMQASLRFYVDRLGFTNVSWGSDDFTSVSRDGATIYLCRGDQGRGAAWIWIGVLDRRRRCRQASRGMQGPGSHHPHAAYEPLLGSRNAGRRPGR